MHPARVPALEAMKVEVLKRVREQVRKEVAAYRAQNDPITAVISSLRGGR